MPSKARAALDKNLKDVKALLDLHQEKGGNAPGRRYGLEVLTKSAIVLTTSYWEAYCEEIAEEGLELIVNHASSSEKLPKEIKKLIAKELKSKADELAIWDIADEKWRSVLKDRLMQLQANRNRKLNTPKYKNIDELFESAIGLSNVSEKWNWAKKLPPQKAREKLDRFVEIRGEIAHRGRAKSTVTKELAVDYLDFIKRAAGKTGGAVNQHVLAITGHALFEVKIP
ncbi:hypothetical protein B9Z35_05715 [Limnohabitans sp. Jir61]|uniref:HEPN domain-containing protein n=1 Tax=Limnohabitans sp. Jir61 TaxID=1826168 RepID=UPI000D37EF1B|nr:HEPN domain-containing protein [Limnohabitans sp. Jir61]PUE33020.1 hypothetical protein B9Z35_05715 [Limnohabitans sp. Jir61]